MGNVPGFAAVLICLATGAVAQPMAPDPGLPGMVVRADFVFDNAVRKTRDLPTAALQAARRKMISGAAMGPTDLRALADAGDGLAAFRYARLLQEKETPDPTGAAAHYYAIAAYTGRAFAVPPLARLLRDEGAGYSAGRLTHGLNAMTVQALSGNAVASTLLGQMYADGVPFGRDLAQAQNYLGMASGGGSPRAALQLGVALMSDPADAATGHPGARSALALAAAGEDLSVRVTAENLLRMIDGMPSPQPEVTR
ncbi:hypothetical protein RNZ50_19120 [Paracoccaceae bacterium Fryx2]|nr:hypothetical protein [Paracoccaceae bacterium Fryx2]